MGVNDNVLLALSGGVDSSTLAYLLSSVIPNNIYFILVDNGLMRHNEIEEVVSSYDDCVKKHIYVAYEGDLFLNRLAGIVEPEEKRKIIGRTFIDVIVEYANTLQNIGINITHLGQGTIYPDVIESGKIPHSKVIKSHHNVGGLPEELNLELLEPLRYLFKDDVRKLAQLVNMPPSIISRRPFPGPGLAIRIIGDITREKVEILRKADYILRESLKRHNVDVWQSAVILLPVKTVGVMGDIRTYQNVVALRLVDSINGMTATASRVSIDILIDISTKITNEVKGISRVVYDLSSKPPATIEWE